jgi:hypothetical protein
LTSLAQLLDNIADHNATLLRLLTEPGVPADLAERLKQHILIEERENSVKLAGLLQQKPNAVTQKLLDHSFFLQRLIEEDSIAVDFQKELLHHFMEEHSEWLSAMTDNQERPTWTVGPLWPKGAWCVEKLSKAD